MALKITSKMNLFLKLSLCSVLIFGITRVQAQDLFGDLDQLTQDSTKVEYTQATFKSTRVINGQSVEMPAKNELLFIIAHRFGSFENGAYDIFGLDQATMRMGFEYTLPTDFVCLSVGRSTYQKTFDGGVKVKLLRQKSGYKNFPLTLDWYSSTAINSLKWANPDRTNYFSSRLSFAHQLLIARKFSDALSMQLTPTVLHKNLVTKKSEANTFYAVGIGGRYKISRRVALTAEYFHLLSVGEKSIPLVNGVNPVNTLSVGVDIETGGHVFSLAFTNSPAMYDPGFISETTQTWQDLGVHFGFNVNRTFSFRH